MQLKKTFTYLLTTLCISTFSMSSETTAVEIRGKILSSNGIPITLSPLGGYFGKLSETELVGKMGLQKQYDDDLSNGRDVQTFIDEKLQTSIDLLTSQAKKDLNATEVLAMVMESKTGKMVAMSSSNRYNPLRIKMEDVPKLNPKFAQYPYEPGAVMMPFTVAMWLNSHLGERNLYKKWFNTDYDKLQIGDNAWIHDDVKKKAQRVSNMLLHSSSVGISLVAKEISAEIFSYALDNYGFGHKSGIDLPRDLEGHLKESAIYESYMHRANTAYGYGIMATPLQLLKAYSMFSNEGWMVIPRIATSVELQRKEVLAKPVANKMKKMLIDVVQNGTAKNTQIEGLTIGGKTGTAHIAKNGKYVKSYHSSFYGFAEDGAGHSYTIGVLVIEPKAKGMYFASRSAVPLFKNVVETLVKNKMLFSYTQNLEVLKERQKELALLNSRLRIKNDGKSYASYRPHGEKAISPLQDAEVAKAFGTYTDPVYKIKIFNESVTLKATEGKNKVYNVLDGKVIFAGKSKTLGKVIVMRHANKLHTVYAGLTHIAPSLRVGQKLKQGYVIGKVKDKLLFQVTQDKKHVDPMALIEQKHKKAKYIKKCDFNHDGVTDYSTDDVMQGKVSKVEALKELQCTLEGLELALQSRDLKQWIKEHYDYDAVEQSVKKSPDVTQNPMLHKLLCLYMMDKKGIDKTHADYSKYLDYCNALGVSKSKWLTPSDKECTKHGGKLASNGICLVNWDNAKNICDAVGGSVPSINALKTFVTNCGGKVDEYDDNRNNASYQACYKEKGFSTLGHYWSSSVDTAVEEYAWTLYFQGGYTNYLEKTDESYVRCVK